MNGMTEAKMAGPRTDQIRSNSAVMPTQPVFSRIATANENLGAILSRIQNARQRFRPTPEAGTKPGLDCDGVDALSTSVLNNTDCIQKELLDLFESLGI